MTNIFGVLNDEYWLLAVLTAILLAILFAILEWLRVNRKSVFLRICITFLAITCLLLIFLKPYYLSKSSINVALIFTEGSSHRDSLINEYPNATLINWTDTANIHTLTSNFIIDGYGIPSYDLWKFNDKSVEFVEVDKPAGFIDFDYRSKVKVGAEVKIKLKINQLGKHHVALITQGAVSDSVYLREDSLKTIELVYKPITAGKFVLKVEAINSQRQTVISEPLPIEVIQEEKLKILILNSQPTFESRFLKNHLVQQGHAVFTRSEITTGRYNFESTGFEFTRLDQLTQKNLEAFDLVIASSITLSELLRSEKNALRNQVGEAGLGVIVLQNEALSGALPDWLRFKLKDFSTDEKFIEVTLSEQKTKLEAPKATFLDNGLQEPILSSQGEALAVVKPYGQGLVASSVVNNTYKLALKGEKGSFEVFWGAVIESVLKDTATDVIIKSKIPVEHEPVELQLWSNSALPEVVYQSASLPIIQREFIPQRWSTTIRPWGSGWQNVTLNDTDHAFYVFEEYDWRPFRNYKSYQINKKHFSEGAVTDSELNDVKILISLWWFYLLFLCSMAYLWLQPKLS